VQVLPVYCYDPRFFAASRWGNSKTGPHRAAFLQQCVAGLRSSLQALGSGLLVAVGPPEALLPAALEGVAPGGGLVLCQEEVTSEETAVDAAVARSIKVGTAAWCVAKAIKVGTHLQCSTWPLS
jgi:deoxyribodipyrimidine photo-lyase